MSDNASPPGATLRDAMAKRGIDGLGLSILTDVSTKHISCILVGRNRITPRFALALEQAMPGISAEFWCRRQADYDIACLRAASKTTP